MQDKPFKVIVVGDPSAKKSSIANIFFGPPYEQEFQAIFEPTYTVATIPFDGHKVKIQIWDTAGQERFHSISEMFYREADVAIIIYSISDAKSFENVDLYLSRIQQNVKTQIPIFLVGNQIDEILKSQEPVITRDIGESKAKSIGALFFQIEGVNGLGIMELLEEVAKTCFQNSNRIEINQDTREDEKQELIFKENKNVFLWNSINLFLFNFIKSIFYIISNVNHLNQISL